MLRKITVYLGIILFVSGCKCDHPVEKNLNSFIKYNLIKPGNGIYAIAEKNVVIEKTKNNYYEIVYYKDSSVIKIERYDVGGKLTDKLSVAAVTLFEYNSDGKVKYIKYYDKDGNKSEDDLFGYWSVEYIYDEHNRVRMEIYRDAESKFLEVPRDKSGNIAKINFLSPVLTYEYIENKLKIKALDQNFNLLKEVLGDKPCIPFIDCGETD